MKEIQFLLAPSALKSLILDLASKHFINYPHFYPEPLPL